MTRPTRAEAPALAAALVGVALFAYASVRAHALSFTFDESFTYTRYVGEPVADLVRFEGANENNHLLNTLLVKASSALFGPSELALRAPNVAAYALYLVSLALALRRVRSWAARSLGFAVATVNPYVLDFFSLARGYGLALGFAAAATAFVLAFRDDGRVRDALAAVVLAALAVASHFSALVVYAGVVSAVLVAALVRRPGDRGHLLRAAAAVTVPTLALAALAVPVLARLSRRGGFEFFGGDRGFWQDTVHSLTWTLLDKTGPEEIAFVLDGVVAALAAVGIAVALVSLRRRRRPPPHAVPLTLLTVAALVSVAPHYLFGDPYVVGRMALYFIPLLAIWLACFIDDAVAPTRLAGAASAVAIVAVALLAVNLARVANLSYVHDWKFDATTERMLTDLRRTASPEPGVVLRLGSSWYFEPTINFYRETRELAWLAPVTPDCRAACVEGPFDYFYVIGPDAELVRKRGARAVEAYPVSGALLAEGRGR